MRWWQTLLAQYHYPALPPEPLPAALPTMPPRRPLGTTHHCGHAHDSYATCPRTFRTRCLPCHQRQFQ